MTAPPLAWTKSQLTVIEAPPAARILVDAGPGTGKTAVACARVGHLVSQGLSPDRIQMFSFTRTAVAEMRNRIIDHVGPAGRRVRITTLDSDAWRLRYGFDLGPVDELLTGDHDEGIQHALELLRNPRDEILDFIERIEHVLVDEAQDLNGVRAELVRAFIERIQRQCGVSIFFDPHQAIYAFASDGDAPPDRRPLVLLDAIEARGDFRHEALSEVHRFAPALRSFMSGARAIVQDDSRPGGQILDALATHARASTQLTQLLDFVATEPDRSLALFRFRMDVVVASELLRARNVRHRLRLSKVPRPPAPWIGWLLGTWTEPAIGRSEFDRRWSELAVDQIAGDLTVDAAWERLTRSAGSDGRDVDLVRLRNVMGRAACPVDLCVPECGSAGPVIGTIHASKGREAPRVLVSFGGHLPDPEEAAEEARVLYVALTRARDCLQHEVRSSVKGKTSGRGRASGWIGGELRVELGLEDDVDVLSPADTSVVETSAAALRVQLALMESSQAMSPLEVVSEGGESPFRIYLPEDDGEVGPLGQLDWEVGREIRGLLPRAKKSGARRARAVRDQLSGLWLMGLRTAALPEDHPRLASIAEPYRSSGFWLAPVVRGFPALAGGRK